MLTCAPAQRSPRSTPAARDAVENVYDPNACQPSDRRFSTAVDEAVVRQRIFVGIRQQKPAIGVALTSLNTGTVRAVRQQRACSWHTDRRHPSTR